MAWISLGLSVVAMALSFGFGFHRSSLSRRVGELEASNAQLRDEIKWLRKRASQQVRPPLTGKQSVHVLRRLQDDTDPAA